MIYGTNARFASRRGQEILGWEIHEKGLEVEIPRAVALEAKTLAGKVDK
jgi:hypothetical protein